MPVAPPRPMASAGITTHLRCSRLTGEGAHGETSPRFAPHLASETRSTTNLKKLPRRKTDKRASSAQGRLAVQSGIRVLLKVNRTEWDTMIGKVKAKRSFRSAITYHGGSPMFLVRGTEMLGVLTACRTPPHHGRFRLCPSSTRWRWS